MEENFITSIRLRSNHRTHQQV